ncbi:GntR family transcriptional regulator [Pseudomonas syringae pv. coryli]|uniref:GntR family transcriptional regulator n=1 Tax=Pseudomonas syringae pv. coryli TaxID=317659 RepID=A0A0P9MFK3_9PSED|nr:GntR family transcriptional regulator [Pseudomonas syringae pv. coryli]
MPFSPRPTSPRCAKWPCRRRRRKSITIWRRATGNWASRPRRFAGGCWWASMGISMPSVWCVTPVGLPSVAICRGAPCMWTTGKPSTSSPARVCKAPSNWPSGSAAKRFRCAPGRLPARWCSMPSNDVPAWCWSASRVGTGGVKSSAAVWLRVCCAKGTGWKSRYSTTARNCPISRRVRVRLAKWCGSITAWLSSLR